MGAQVQVLSLDLTDRVAVEQSLKTIHETMGAIGGVIHCAGMVNKQNPAFIRKSLEEIGQVLEPKVEGLQTLFDLLQDEPLAFFTLFSSVSAAIPALAAGQADYAMANAFMDYFAEAHQDKCPIVSIQWPNWKETGLGEVRSKALEQTGLISLTNDEGLQLLDQILSDRQYAVVLPAVPDTNVWKPDKLMQPSLPVEALSHPETKEQTSTRNLFPETVDWLVTLFSDELKIAAEDFETDEPFQEYGIDSIILAQLVQQMNQQLNGDIDPSILFEYPTIESFAHWLISKYDISAVLQPSVPEKQTPLKPQSAMKQKLVPEQRPQQISHEKTALLAEDIAIIGLSCRFPGAETLEEYWDLIRDGRSAIDRKSVV